MAAAPPARGIGPYFAGGGMTKASMGELVDDLETLGYVRRVEDPDDRRAKRVLLTDAGLEVARLARRAIADIERRWTARIGARAFRALSGVLDRLAFDDRARRRREDGERA